MMKLSGVAFDTGAEKATSAIVNTVASKIKRTGSSTPRWGTRLSMARASRRFLTGCAALFQARIEGVAEAVTEEVEAEDGDEDGQPREERQPGVGLDEGHIGLEVPAPARGGRLRPQAEEGEGGLHDDRGGDADGGGHDDRGQAVGQHVAREDPRVALANGAAGLDVLLLFDGQHAAADQTRVDRDAHDGDGARDLDGAD